MLRGGLGGATPGSSGATSLDGDEGGRTGVATTLVGVGADPPRDAVVVVTGGPERESSGDSVCGAVGFEFESAEVCSTACVGGLLSVGPGDPSGAVGACSPAGVGPLLVGFGEGAPGP